MSGDLFSAARRPKANPGRPKVDPGPSRGSAIKPAKPVAEDHRCAVCGRWCGFGFGFSARLGAPGRWACLAHRDAVEAMVR